jgi:aldehyde:ferredoxin oxidoreductase
MFGGYMGKLLFVNLSTGEIRDMVPDENLLKNFIGGYGIGSRLMYDLQKPKVDALGPENMLGLITGPLTGTPAMMGVRFTAMAKSPLTKSWGDSNCGGDFGPRFKFAGFDGVFFTGISEKPVYLLIDNGKAELRDAAHLWGKNTYETEDVLKAELDKSAEIACVGPSGERLSLISCIATRKGTAGRSGLGAVMGSKKLKAVAVKGDREVPIVDKNEVERLFKENLAQLRAAKMGVVNFYDRWHKYGTSASGEQSAKTGDSPVKNWGGVGVIDFPDASGLSGEAAISNLEKRFACWRCPLACRAWLKEGAGEYKYPARVRRLEYETQAAFGSMCLINNTESIAMANHLCNYYGLDTISAGATIAFAMECYENGLITRSDTDGIELTWGNHRAMVAMLEKMANREGFGDILADGTRVAAQKIGKGASQYAVHVDGQEPGLHDPKFPFNHRGPAAARLVLDATPGRHSQGSGPSGYLGHARNALGICLSGYGVPSGGEFLAGYMTAVTGRHWSVDELLTAGDRIATMRHVFNFREGINPLKRDVHPRIVGTPPQKEGPLAGVTADLEAQMIWNLGGMDWDRITTKPSKEKLLKLGGLDDVARELWP